VPSLWSHQTKSMDVFTFQLYYCYMRWIKWRPQQFPLSGKNFIEIKWSIIFLHQFLYLFLIFDFQENYNHCLHLNLCTLRIWCYICVSEVFLLNNDPAVSPNLFSILSRDDDLSHISPDKEIGIPLIVCTSLYIHSIEFVLHSLQVLLDFKTLEIPVTWIQYFKLFQIFHLWLSISLGVELF